MHGIEWLNRPGTVGESWNPVSGCTPISEGCLHCYAQRMARRLAGRFGYPADYPFRVTWHADKIEQPLHWSKPRTVFVVSMGDLFHQQLSHGIINHVFHVMVNQAPQHTYIVLTKRAEQMAEFLQTTRWLDRGGPEGPAKNVWLGVTAENDARAAERLPFLRATPAWLRYMSVEPMLGPMKIEPWLDWVICGAETGPGARPMDLAWARDLLGQCRAAGIPFFWKRAGPRQETPPDLMVREWPKEA